MKQPVEQADLAVQGENRSVLVRIMREVIGRDPTAYDFHSQPGIDGEVQIFPYVCAFPYEAEQFTGDEKKILLRHFTNVDGSIFAIKGLPQEVVGAMFSRYSRSAKGVRRVFLDEFMTSPALAQQHVAEYLEEQGVDEEELKAALQRTNVFYRQVFAEYGDKSVIQMGVVHIAFEGVSQIAAKAIEDQRVASAYIERSTRYVPFDQKTVGGHWLYMEEQDIMLTAPEDVKREYLRWNDSLFEAYSKHIPTAVEHFRKKYPIEEQVFDIGDGRFVHLADVTDDKNRGIVTRAYDRALRAKALDTVRVFLPTTTVTSLGAVWSGQSAENAVYKLMSSPYREVRLIGISALQEMLKVIPNFLQNVPRHGPQMRRYLKDVREAQEQVADSVVDEIKEVEDAKDVQLVGFERDTDILLAAQILYDGQGRVHRSKEAVLKWAHWVKEEDRRLYPGLSYSPRLAEIILRSVPDRKALTREHKLPRAFESAYAEVEYYCDFGIFRDLQRNRLSLTERQQLSADEVFVPREMKEPGMEEVLADYLELAGWTRGLNNKVAQLGSQYERAAEYITILGNKLRFNIKANIRQWVFFSELRTIPGGHPTYRNAVQESVRQILDIFPFMKPLFTHVDWTEDYGLGRLRAEVKTQQRLVQE